MLRQCIVSMSVLGVHFQHLYNQYWLYPGVAFCDYPQFEITPSVLNIYVYIYYIQRLWNVAIRGVIPALHIFYNVNISNLLTNLLSVDYKHLCMYCYNVVVYVITQCYP